MRNPIKFSAFDATGQWLACGLFCVFLGACSTTGTVNHSANESSLHAASKASHGDLPPSVDTLPDAPTMESSYKMESDRTSVIDLPTAMDFSVKEYRPLVDELESAPEWTRTPEDVTPLPQPEPPPALAEATEEIALPWVDDMDRASLKDAIRKQLGVMEPGDLNRRVRIGPRVVTRRQLVDTLHVFMELLEQDMSDEAFTRKLNEQFDVIPALPPGTQRPALFTGYYTPIIPARRQKTDDYIYPLYQKPDWYPAEQAASHNRGIPNLDPGYHLTQVAKPALLTRAEIDGGQALRDQQLEVAWLKDDLERYFLHIQGSGYLAFPDGTLQSVQYMGSNHFPYRSVGLQMMRDGAITRSQGSMQGMKQYFRDHPENINRYLFRNNRYIFFQMSEYGPRGSGGGELVGGRSIATDKKLYPAGGLAYITIEKPILNSNLEITGWEKVSRFVMDQDTGAAIKGPGRVDIYFGVGDRAGAAAGHYKRTGTLVYLLKK